jgi:hypothetical protein
MIVEYQLLLARRVISCGQPSHNQAIEFRFEIGDDASAAWTCMMPSSIRRVSLIHASFSLRHSTVYPATFDHQSSG